MSDAAPIFKKKARGARELRKRSLSPSAALDATDDGPSTSSAAKDEGGVVQRKKAQGYNPLRQGTSLASRKRAKLGDEPSSDSDEEEGKEGALHHPMDRALAPVAQKSAAAERHSWVGGLGGKMDDAARGAHAVETFRTSSGTGSTSTAGAGAAAQPDDGNYHGASAYASYVAPRDDGRSSMSKSTGPIRQSANVRTVTVTDYQPDVCKDYKETGYCGFGDTCKFLHDRSDYLAGWQLDALPNSTARQLDAEESEEEEEIPFACLICRKPFTDPIVTRCGHYFCSACAIKRYARTPKCFACGAQTQGIFNAASKVLERMQRAKEVREKDRGERRKGWGDEDEEQQDGGMLEGVEIGGASEEEDEE